MNAFQVAQLFVYPIKGLSPKKSYRIELRVGHGIPGDRAFALMFEQEGLATDRRQVEWMKKQNFANQNDWHGLAALDCDYDETDGTLVVKRKDVQLLVANTNNEIERDKINAFFTGYLAAIYPSQAAKHPDRKPLQLVGDGQNTRYPDREAVHISLVSQATIDNLSEIAGQKVDVRRFRPNIVVEGIPAWSEFEWVGKEIQIGTARIEVSARINRCLNIDVNPETGERDINLLSLLQKNFPHTQTGIVAKVISDGVVAVGDK